MRIAAVIPAYNEETRIGAVLDVLTNSSLLDEIIVVSDGSTDKTYETASAYPGVTAIRLPGNTGKGGAMLAGVSQTYADVIVFLDADLIGLSTAHVDALVKPLADGTADMSIGTFRGGRRRTDWAQVIAPYISGQRALRREDFLSVPGLDAARYGVEVAMGKYAREKGLSTVMVPFYGVTHTMKEEKLGFLAGSMARGKMYWEIAKLLLRVSDRASSLKHLLGITGDR